MGTFHHPFHEPTLGNTAIVDLELVWLAWGPTDRQSLENTNGRNPGWYGWHKLMK